MLTDGKFVEHSNGEMRVECNRRVEFLDELFVGAKSVSGCGCLARCVASSVRIRILVEKNWFKDWFIARGHLYDIMLTIG